MKIIIKCNREGYGEVWFGMMRLYTGDMINPQCLREVLTKLGFIVSFEEL
jgi:hypothetical protein